jgi:hypothetical protein
MTVQLEIFAERAASLQSPLGTPPFVVNAHPLTPLMGKIVGRIFIGFVSFLISFISYSSQIFIIWPWYGSVLSVELILLLAPFK